MTTCLHNNSSPIEHKIGQKTLDFILSCTFEIIKQTYQSNLRNKEILATSMACIELEKVKQIAFQNKCQNIARLSKEISRNLLPSLALPVLILRGGVSVPSWLLGTGVKVTKFLYDKWSDKKKEEEKNNPQKIWQSIEQEFSKSTKSVSLFCFKRCIKKPSNAI